jgi:hypothetical protein
MLRRHAKGGRSICLHTLMACTSGNLPDGTTYSSRRSVSTRAGISVETMDCRRCCRPTTQRIGFWAPTMEDWADDPASTTGTAAWRNGTPAFRSSRPLMIFVVVTFRAASVRPAGPSKVDTFICAILAEDFRRVLQKKRRLIEQQRIAIFGVTHHHRCRRRCSRIYAAPARWSF